MKQLPSMTATFSMYTVMSAGGTENRATFDGIFMETPSTNALGFNATFSNGAVLNLVVPGLDITGWRQYLGRLHSCNQ